VLEHAELGGPQPGRNLLELDSFGKLCDIF